MFKLRYAEELRARKLRHCQPYPQASVEEEVIVPASVQPSTHTSPEASLNLLDDLLSVVSQAQASKTSITTESDLTLSSSSTKPRAVFRQPLKSILRKSNKTQTDDTSRKVTITTPLADKYKHRPALSWWYSQPTTSGTEKGIGHETQSRKRQRRDSESSTTGSVSSVVISDETDDDESPPPPSFAVPPDAQQGLKPLKVSTSSKKTKSQDVLQTPVNHVAPSPATRPAAHSVPNEVEQAPLDLSGCADAMEDTEKLFVIELEGIFQKHHMAAELPNGILDKAVQHFRQKFTPIILARYEKERELQNTMEQGSREHRHGRNRHQPPDRPYSSDGGRHRRSNGGFRQDTSRKTDTLQNHADYSTGTNFNQNRDQEIQKWMSKIGWNNQALD